MNGLIGNHVTHFFLSLEMNAAPIPGNKNLHHAPSGDRTQDLLKSTLMLMRLCWPDMCYLEDLQTEFCLMHYFTFWNWISSKINGA